ncbi:hypothetical protein RVS70_05665 [Virgibacillus sp. M23]|uniref:hypothetical protein n=1 Tax=Virgibacillus sp. M23 TaxID=3079030 RepID=UPI002A910185|nr:hypothetical protein [Virgibacillus sp. M23]MDY7043688.1 hypothetical protein [Virgibacillus sp. M23]
MSTNEWTSERVYANAKGTRSIAWDADKQGTLAVETEIFDLKWLAIMAGSDVVKGEKNISKRQVVHVDNTKKVTLDGSAVEGSIAVVPVGEDETEHIGEPLDNVVVDGTEVTEVGAGQVGISGSELTFNADEIDGTPYAVYYLVAQSDVRTITISADKFPKAYRVVADALIREKETGRDEFVQIEYPNARPQGNYTITMSASEPTNLAVTFDLFPNKDKAIAEYKVITD